MTALTAHYDICLFEKISPPFGCVACKIGISTGIQAKLSGTPSMILEKNHNAL